MMIELTNYQATDRRVYNGCPSSDMSKQWKHTDDLTKRMQKADPTAGCTYFPVEGKYLVFTNSKGSLSWEEYTELEGPPKELTGKMHYDKQDALIEAIKILEEV